MRRFIGPLIASLLAAGAILAGMPGYAAEGVDPALAAVIAGEHRSGANKARDQFRHPAETLTFFGLKPDMRVVEIWPAGGWYAEILGPYLGKGGKYYAAGWDPDAKAEFIQLGIKAFRDKLAASSSSDRIRTIARARP